MKVMHFFKWCILLKKWCTENQHQTSSTLHTSDSLLQGGNPCPLRTDIMEREKEENSIYSIPIIKCNFFFI